MAKTKEKPAPEVQFWLDELEAAREREKTYRDKGEDIVEIYEGENPDAVPFNVLFSNTETLKPALYSNEPRPVVRPRHKNKQNHPLFRHASTAAERMLSFLIDSTVDNNFSDVMTNAVQDALLPGRGDICIKYDAEESGFETIYLENQQWDRVFFGFARDYKDIPWKAYELFLQKDEATRLFGKTKANKLSYSDNEDRDEDEDPNEDKGAIETAQVYQIYEKKTRKIHYVAPSFPKGILFSTDDPYNFQDFFNSPKPLQLINKTKSIVPTALYTIYENQAEELNELTVRIEMVAKAIKVRGLYNGQFSGAMEDILSGDDNELIPTDDAATLSKEKLADQIWFMPLGELITVHQTLLQARESVKQVIYEITGISDILRGQSRASETLGAQKIKEAWGTLRIKDHQKQVQKFVRQTLRMMLELACEKFSDQSWMDMTGLPYLTDEQFQRAQLVKVQAQAMQMQQMGQPAQPPQEVQQALKTLQQPKWSDVLSILRDDAKRMFAVDIETNSTLDTEATEDKKEVAEFMNAMGQFNNAMAPMVKEGILPFEAYKSMLLGVTQRYRFGDDVENEIRTMKPPKNLGVDPKKLQEFKKAQEDFAKQKQGFQDEVQKAGDKLDDDFMKLEREKLQFEYEKKLWAEQQKYQQQLNEMKVSMKEEKAKSELNSMIDKHETKVQGLLDKARNNIKNDTQQAIQKATDSLKETSEDKKETIIMPVPSRKVVEMQTPTGNTYKGEVTEIYEDTE